MAALPLLSSARCRRGGTIATGKAEPRTVGCEQRRAMEIAADAAAIGIAHWSTVISYHGTKYLSSIYEDLDE